MNRQCYKKEKEKINNESTSFNLLININGRECPKHQPDCFATLEEELQFVPWLRSLNRAMVIRILAILRSRQKRQLK